MSMTKRALLASGVTLAIALAVFGGRAISLQDKYTLQVPDGLAFSEFRGYEGWPVIAISENEGLIAVIVGNPVMIDAYKEGVPGNGKPFPDGAKMAKIHWNPKKQEAYPGQPTVPGTQHDVDFMVKDSKRFADSGGWGYAVFNYDAGSDNFMPGTEADTPPQGHNARDHRRWSRFSSKTVTRFHRRRPPIFMKVATSKSSQHDTRRG